jgi:hypothetical protein
VWGFVMHMLQVPTVSLEILAHKTLANKDTAPHNLGGFAIGNDCPGNQIYTCTPYSGWRGVKVALVSAALPSFAWPIVIVIYR